MQNVAMGLENIIHGGLTLYVKHLGTDKVSEAVQIVSKALMTAREIGFDLATHMISDDFVTLQHMRYNTNMGAVHSSIVDDIMLKVMLKSMHEDSYLANIMDEIDVEYLTKTKIPDSILSLPRGRNGYNTSETVEENKYEVGRRG